MNVPFNVNLENKVVVITGAGGIICSEFAKALAECGAKVALLDINYEAAAKFAEEIGDNAIAIRCNCLDKESIIEAKKTVNESFGEVNFLINGAGGNNPRASTDNETMTPDLEGVKDFFALEESGLKFVFDLNITSAFLVTQVFATDMVKTGGNIINISSMNAYRPLTKIPSSRLISTPDARSGERNDESSSGTTPRTLTAPPVTIPAAIDVPASIISPSTVTEPPESSPPKTVATSPFISISAPAETR